MGGFLLIHKSESSDIKTLEQQYRNSLDVFVKKGLPLNRRIITKEFVIYVFHKYQFNVNNLVIFDKNKFIISTGCCIYNQKIGHNALIELYEDFSEEGRFFSNISGNYCVIISKNDKLYLFNDYTGIYHVYTNESKNVISNSFLTILKTLNQRTISSQELYEFVINEVFYGDKTLIKEINLIDSKNIHQLYPKLSVIAKAIKPEILSKNFSFDEMKQRVTNNLIDYFTILQKNFGNSISTALSGGFDSRLTLGLMRKVRIEPNLYVYGKEDSTDVKIAKLITKEENLELEVKDKDKFPKFKEEEFLQHLEKQYYLFDGFGSGIFDNGSDLSTRLERSKESNLQINGGGGEIFRNFWELPDKTYSIKSFLKSKYDCVNYRICTHHFNKKTYFLTLSDKIKTILNTHNNQINRQQIEMLYPFLRLKYWMGPNDSINNQFAYSLTPYTDIRFIFDSFDIPIKFKNIGIFEAAMIRSIDPVLAKYPSQYGFNFFDPIKSSTKIKYFFEINLPIFLRPFIRKHVLSRATRDKNKFPFYFEKNYLNKIFLSNHLTISKYFNIDKIDDPKILSRVLTAELLITDRF
jgi:asparagine synthase (glutamine-hydrolysing)